MKYRSLLLGAIGALLLSGCVSETSYRDSERPVANQNVDAETAASGRVKLGLTYLKSGNTEAAKYNLERALTHAPEMAQANYAMAYYYQTVQETELALKYYEKSVRLEPDNGDIRNAYGAYLCSLHQFEASETQLLKAVNAPGYVLTADSYVNLGICSHEAGWADKAEHYLTKALSYNPLRGDALLELAQLTFEQGKLIDSRRYLDKFHRNYPVNPISALLAWQQAEMTQDVVTAKKYSDILVGSFPNSKQTRLYMQKKYKKN